MNNPVLNPFTGRLEILPEDETGVLGPATTTDNALVRWDGVTGENIQNSGAILADTGTLTLTSHLLISADDGGTLGASGTAWSDLFLASGGVINWNAGDVTLIHSSNTLTMAGALVVDGDTDLVQLTVQAHSTQTSLLSVWESSAGADQITFGGTGAAVFNEAGNAVDFRIESDDDANIMLVSGANDVVCFGTNETSLTINGSVVIPKVLVKDGAGDANISFITYSDSDVAQQGAFCVFARSRSSGTAVQSGDRIGVFRADGHEGTDFRTGGAIQFTVDAAPTLTHVPIKIEFATDDGTNGNLIKMTLDSTGFLGIGTNSPDVALDVRGAVIFNQAGDDYDFRVEGDTSVNLFRCDAGLDAVGIGVAGFGGIADFRASNIVMNELGADCDFRIEGDTDIQLFFCDAGVDTITIGSNTSLGKLGIDGDQDEIQFVVQGHTTQTSLLSVWEDSAGADQITFAVSGAVVINETGNDADFRVEGDTATSLFVCDAGLDAVQIGTTTAGAISSFTSSSIIFEVPTICDLTNAEAFLIRQNSDVGDVLTVNTTDLGASGSSTGLTFQANGGTELTPGAFGIVVQNNIAYIGTTGTQSGSVWGFVNEIRVRGSTILSTGDLRGIMGTSTWASTGTCSTMQGLVSITYVGGGNTVAAGTVTTQTGGRFSVGFYPSAGAGELNQPLSGAITTAYSLLLNSPDGTSASHTIGTHYGLRIENTRLTGITTAYAISTGTGLVNLGDSVTIDGSQDAVQLTVQSNATQTSLLAVFEDSAGLDQVTISGSGLLVVNEQGNDVDSRIEGVSYNNLLYVDAGNSRIGIRTSIPRTIFEVVNENNFTTISSSAYSNTASHSSRLFLLHARGSEATPTATQSGDTLGEIHFQGYDTTISTGAVIRGIADAEWGTAGDTTDDPTRLEFLTVPDGSDTATIRLVIDSSGEVIIGGSTSGTGKLVVEQTSTTGAMPVFSLSQSDVSEEFIRFIGSNSGNTLVDSIVNTNDVGAATIQGYLRVYVQDDSAADPLTDQAYYIPIYTLA